MKKPLSVVVISSNKIEYDKEKNSDIVDTPEYVEEFSGKLSKQDEEDKLMHTVLEGDKETIKDGKIIADVVSQGLNSLTPDLIFENLVKDYKIANDLYGETLLKELTGYSDDYIKKNINIPEFKKRIQQKIKERVESLKEKGLLNDDGELTDKALTLSALVLYAEELDYLIPKGFGEKQYKKKTHYGEKIDVIDYKKTRYRDLALKASIKKALRRGHEEIAKSDLKIHLRDSRGKISIIYGIDASGSMRGEKLKIAKKAGIALAFKAINEKNKVGLIVFGSEIKKYLKPTNDFLLLIKELASIKASHETDIAKTINKSIELFPKYETKHLVLITDAVPTKGEKPEEETLKAVSSACNDNITISLIGINLDNEGFRIGKRITEIGNGKLYRVTELEKIDKIILEDYYIIKK
ncbi:MAG: VWA domain-containing protein [Candidatus Woesearchaeota archaeon]